MDDQRNGPRPTHPGEVLRKDYLEPMGLTQRELADAIRVPYQRVNELVRVKRGVTPSTALRLARGATGRHRILKFDGCYHGHSDALLVSGGSGLATFGTSSSAGIPTRPSGLAGRSPPRPAARSGCGRPKGGS